MNRRDRERLPGRALALTLVLGFLVVGVTNARRARPLLAQTAATSAPSELVNGDMESLDALGQLVGWRLPSPLAREGYVIGPLAEFPFEGERCAGIDSRPASPGPNSFGNLMQSLDASPWRGKRVRFRAAVNVAEGEADGRAQMWLRVDLTPSGGTPRTGFFDNMGDRPIQSAEWGHYEIIGDIDKDAQTIALGVLTLGRCMVLVDDVTLEVVEADVQSTGGRAVLGASTQAFFTPWLWLPAFALTLFAMAFHGRGRIGKYAFAFTLAYWFLYAFTTLLRYIVPVAGAGWGAAIEAGPLDALVRWAAPALFGIEGELVSAINNGSGDSTYSYIQTFLTFVMALGLALLLGTLWARFDRSTGEPARGRDVLRSLLRYYLAIYMATYGLAKLSSLWNQFPPPGTWRLAQTYGQSSPMGLLWTFMGSSRAYTYFAGAAELFGAFLLVWRRTALLGALVSFGVMLNVMLMNFCYDVPVKLFSAHLVIAAGLIALPEVGRLAQLFLGLGSGASAKLACPFRGRAGRWGHRGLKAYLVAMVLVLPLVERELAERETSSVWPALGEWKLVTLELDGAAAPPAAGEVESLTITPRPVSSGEAFRVPYQATLVGGSVISGSLSLTRDTLTIEAASDSTSRVLPGEFRWRVENDELRLESAFVRALFTPAAHDYLLMRRGFRWINERPYNR